MYAAVGPALNGKQILKELRPDGKARQILHGHSHLF